MVLVESPNDEFQLVRDFVDATNFHHLKSFDKEKLKKLHYQEMVEEFKYLYKVNQVYFIVSRMLFNDDFNKYLNRKYILSLYPICNRLYCFVPSMIKSGDKLTHKLTRLG